jgi:hypothetical protein
MSLVILLNLLKCDSCEPRVPVNNRNVFLPITCTNIPWIYEDAERFFTWCNILLMLVMMIFLTASTVGGSVVNIGGAVSGVSSLQSAL